MAASHATWPQGITTVAVRQCKPTDCVQFHITACSHDRNIDHRATAQTGLEKTDARAWRPVLLCDKCTLTCINTV